MNQLLTGEIIMLGEGSPCLSSDLNVANRRKLIGRVLANEPDGLYCLDAGCGYGVYLDTIAQKSNFIFGGDINYFNLVVARSSNPSHFFGQLSLDTLPFSSSLFDLIVCIETLEHVDRDEQSIKEFNRVLKPGGRLIVSVPYKGFPFETHGIRVGGKVISSLLGLGFPLLTYLPEDLRRKFATAKVYSRRNIVRMLKANGFKIEQVSFLMPGLDIFERKSGALHLAKLFRMLLNILQILFHKSWGSTIIVLAQSGLSR